MAHIDREAHNQKVSALIHDLVGENLEAIERACTHWIRHSVYMPKAADLIRLVGEMAPIAKPTRETKRDLCDHYNRIMSDEAKARGVECFLDQNDNICFALKAKPRPFAPPLSEQEIRKMPAWVINLGVTIGDLDPERCAQIRGEAFA